MSAPSGKTIQGFVNLNIALRKHMKKYLEKSLCGNCTFKIICILEQLSMNVPRAVTISISQICTHRYIYIVKRNNQASDSILEKVSLWNQQMHQSQK